jgi:hypothetical protein
VASGWIALINAPKGMTGTFSICAGSVCNLKQHLNVTPSYNKSEAYDKFLSGIKYSCDVLLGGHPFPKKSTNYFGDITPWQHIRY